MKEVWKDIKDYEGLYQVSNLGNVKSLRTGKQLYYSLSGKYLRVGLFKNHKRKSFSIHRLVAETFLPNLLNKPCVNHKDCNPVNNCLENLEWVTYKENNNYMHHKLKYKVSILYNLIRDNYSDNNILVDEINKIKHIVENL